MVTAFTKLDEGAMRHGNKLRTERERRGISLRSFAESIGFSPSYVSDIETGKRLGGLPFWVATDKFLGTSFLSEMAGSQEELLRRENAELKAELASFELCEVCRENGKVHVEVPRDMMVDHDEVWALVNGADVYHKRIRKEHNE